MTFRAKDGQILAVFTLVFLTYIFAIFSDWMFVIGRFNFGRSSSLHIAGVIFLTTLAAYIGWQMLRRVGTQIEFGDGMFKLLRRSGRVIRSEPLNTINRLGVRETFFRAPKCLVIQFDGRKDLKFSMEYENLPELVRALEECTGREFVRIPWGT